MIGTVCHSQLGIHCSPLPRVMPAKVIQVRGAELKKERLLRSEAWDDFSKCNYCEKVYTIQAMIYFRDTDHQPNQIQKLVTSFFARAFYQRFTQKWLEKYQIWNQNTPWNR